MLSIRTAPPSAAVVVVTAAVAIMLADVPDHDSTHLADRNLNPADPLATVGADIAAAGPG
jgi:ribonuclease HI